jgi:subtilisin family serine protease
MKLSIFRNKRFWVWLSIILIIFIGSFVAAKLMHLGQASVNNAELQLPASANSSKYDGYIVEFKTNPLSKLFAEKLKEKQQTIINDNLSSKDSVSLINTVYNNELSKAQESLVSSINNERNSFYNKATNLGIEITQSKAESLKNTEINPDNYYKVINAIVVKNIPVNQVELLRNIPEVKSITPNYIAKISLNVSAPLIGADRVWNEVRDSSNLPVTGKGVKVGVIDTGVDYTHPDFGSCTSDQFLANQCAKVIGGYDFVNSDSDPIDDGGHGTHVSSTIASSGNLKGVAPDALIYAYKACDNVGSCPYNSILSALEASLDPNNDGVLDDHLNIVNLSLGGIGSPDSILSLAVDNVADSDVLPVVAAGNNGPRNKTVTSPGNARNALTVGASFKQQYSGTYWEQADPRVDQITSFSSRGPVVWNNLTSFLIKPDVVAPGALICAARWDSWVPGSSLYTTCQDDKHVQLAGTSMATPHISGVAALVLQAHPSWSSQLIKSAIKNTAIDLIEPESSKPYNINTQGFGRVQALQAVVLPDSIPIAKINNGGFLSSNNNSINGTATGSVFEKYTIYYATEDKPDDWKLIKESASQVNNSELANWNTQDIAEGVKVYLRLEVRANNLVFKDHAQFLVQKTIILKPRIYDKDHPKDVYSTQEKIDIVGSSDGKGFLGYTLAWCKADILQEYEGTDNCTTAWNQSGFVTENNGTMPVANGKLGSWEPAKVSGFASGYYLISLTTKSTTTVEYIATIFLNNEIVNNWPITLAECIQDECNKLRTGTYYMGQPILSDINADNKQEIITAVGVRVNVLDGNGAQLPGWPYILNSDERILYGSITAGDINGDSKHELVFRSKRDDAHATTHLYAISSTGQILDNFPLTISPVRQSEYIQKYYDFSEPMIADMDNDGKNDIVLLKDTDVANSENVGFLNIYNYKGDLIVEKNVIYNTNQAHDDISPSNDQLAIGDANNDGKPELIIAHHPKSGNNKVYMYSSQGELISGWPMDIEGFEPMTMVVGDINNDKSSEIIVLSKENVGTNVLGKMYIISITGAIIKSWPIPTNPMPAPIQLSIGDINNDNQLEILASHGISFVAYSNQGNRLFDLSESFYDITNNIGTFISVGKMRSDGIQRSSFIGELGIGFSDGVHYTSQVFTTNDGKKSQGNLNTIEQEPMFDSGAVMGDIDGDNKNEYVIASRLWGSNNYILYAYNTTGLAHSDDWPQRLHNAQHTNFYTKPKSQIVPNAPQDIKLQSTENTVKLNWKSVESVKSYNIYWSNNQNIDRHNGNKISTTSNNYSHVNLTSGKPYYYVITAVSDSGESVESEVKYISTASSSLLYMPDRTTYNGGPAILKGYLYSLPDKKPVSGKMLTFVVKSILGYDEIVGTAVTDVNGCAQLAYRGSVLDITKQVKISVRWPGDEGLKVATTSAKLKYTEAKSNLFVGDRTARVGVPVELKALLRTYGENKPINGETVRCLKPDGSAYVTGITGADGWATLKYTQTKYWGDPLALYMNCYYWGNTSKGLTASSTRILIKILY